MFNVNVPFPIPTPDSVAEYDALKAWAKAHEQATEQEQG